MDKNLKWKMLLIVGLVALFVWASFPLTEISLRDYLVENAVNQDEQFELLVETLERDTEPAEEMVPISPLQELEKEVVAQGADLTRYFPGYEDNRAVLRHLGRQIAGNLNLGLDLQGGMHVILSVDELEFIKKGAVDPDEQFRDFILAVQEETRESARPALAVLREMAQARDFDLTKYYAPHYRDKYGLDEENVPDSNEEIIELFDRELDAANRGSLDILRNRVDRFGVSEPEIQVQGENELLIQMPGISDPRQVMELIQGEAFLEFRLVDDSEERLAKALETGQAPAGFELKTYVGTNRQGEEKTEQLLVREKPELTGDTLDAAFFDIRSDTREPIVRFKFKKKGARIFSNVTRQHNAEDNPPGRRLAILLDGEVLSAPLIRTHIPRGEGFIEGSFGRDEARLLASQLSAGAYPAPLMVKEQRTVGPSLGEDSIKKGIKSALYGLIVVVCFMAVYYLVAGVVADFALCLNIVLIVGALCLLPALFTGFKATLTLPGIAGIILTIGMSVDANVLIFERIREELAEGKRIKQAIASGYQKAFLTILDANLTTLIAALVLLNPMGFGFLPTAGPIKGFALTLTIGILTSMFTALVVTRTVFDLFCLSPGFQNLKMLRFFSNPNFNFVGKRYAAFLLSGILIFLSIVAFVTNGEKNFGIDFSGGILIQREFSRPVPSGDIRGILQEAGLGDASVQSYDDGKGVIIRASIEDSAPVDQALRAGLSDVIEESRFEQRTEMVGPKIGRRLRTQALGAVLLALGAIMIYIWYRFKEFKFALGAVLALAHDVIITMGFLAGFFILPIREYDIPMIAALLTIVGYSLNDTIVVFVRIRENLKVMRGEPLKLVINRSINDVLGRTLLTSVTTLIVVVFLFLFGGAVIADFAFALMIGVLVGTYSSIFIASPVLLWGAGAGKKPEQ